MRTCSIGLLLATLALLASACSLSSHGGSPPSPPTSMPDAGTVGPRASFVVSYTRGAVQRSAAAVHTACPAAATCAVRRVPGWTPHVWVLVVTRRLTCAPAAGQYGSPAEACRALRNMRSLLARKHGACSCPLMMEPTARAVGTVDGRHVVVPLDACTACGLGGRAAHDLSVLTPA